MDQHLFGTYTTLQKEWRLWYSTSFGKVNIFRSKNEGHDITKINNWFEARQDDIGKDGGQNDQFLIMLFRTYLTVPVSEFWYFLVRNKESWGKGDITDPIVLMNDAESKFKILQEDKLWVTNDPTKANLLTLTTVIGKLTRKIDSKVDVKQSDKPLGNFSPSIGSSSNNKKYDPQKPGELLTKMFRKKMKYYCSKWIIEKGFWSWHE